MRNIAYLFLFFAGLSLSSCLYPHRSFDKKKVPEPPDYKKPECWAALPLRNDSADAVPGNSGLKDGQDSALVDVFFIYPTIYVVGHHWNANVYRKRLNHRIQKGTITHQAGVFNGSAKVYSPYYRQAVLSAYWDPKGKPAFDTAYADIKEAFRYYLNYFNFGRPIIIASHSQGTDHAVRLLKDFFDNDPVMRKKLVAAYIIGRPVEKGAFKNIPPADSASQTGCFITWNTIAWGEQKLFNQTFTSLECVNPLSWKRDTVYVPPSANKGSVPISFKHLDKNVCGAKCTPEGYLWVHTPNGPGYLKGNSHHVEDYDLFYLSIRENVRTRVDAYLKKTAGK